MTIVVLLLSLFVASVGYVTAWFIVAKLSDRTDIVDTAWGLGFVYVAWLAYAISGQHHPIQLLAALFVTIWGLRLAGHITSRNLHKSEDYRYVAYRQKWQANYWPKAYVFIFLVQGVLLWAISFSVIATMAAVRHPLIWLAVLGFVVWGGGIIFEAVGDWQLRQFMKTRKPKQIMDSGLWRYSRHPNYFGEVTAWWGASLVAVSLAQWWGLLGAALITFLIIKVSGIPPLEKHYEGNKNFASYKQRTSMFIPLPPHKTR